MGVGTLKESHISSSSFPEARMALQRSDLRAERSKSVSISPSRNSKKGAVGFKVLVFCLKNSSCKFFMCASTACSPMACRRESMVV